MQEYSCFKFALEEYTVPYKFWSYVHDAACTGATVASLSAVFQDSKE
jgi:hypothetical protein